MIEPAEPAESVELAEPAEPAEQNPGQEQPGSQKRAALIAVAVLVAVVALALAGYRTISAAQPSASSAASQYAIAQGDASPDAASQAEAQRALSCEIVTFDGEDVTIGQVSDGKPLVVNMWATWCPYCIAEMQDYQQLFDTYGDKVRFVMLNACDSSREVSLAREYVNESGFTFPVYYDAEHQVQRLFGVSAYPTTIILSDSGRLLLSRPGQIDYESMDATLAALVGS